MSMVYARILLRYLSGILMAAGYLDAELAGMIAVDPDLLMLIGAGLAAFTEGVYAAAKRMGWAT